MKQIIKIIILLILISGCRSQSEVGFYINESWLPHHYMCFATRINIRNDSTFEYFFQGDLFNDHEIGKYQRIGNRLYFSYKKKEKIILGYDTVRQKLDFNPPIVVTRIEPWVMDPGFRDNFPVELLINRKNLFIIQNQKMEIKPSDKKIKLKKVKRRNWNNRNVTFMEYIRSQ